MARGARRSRRTAARCRALAQRGRLRGLVAESRAASRASALADAQARGLRVVPWTVNQPADMARLVDWGVDGLITDYPDRARKVLADKGVALR